MKPIPTGAGDLRVSRPKGLGPRVCAEEGCDLPVKARGWCRLHYERWMAANQRPRLTPIDRFLQKVAIVDLGRTTACWLWTGSRTSMGYGKFWSGTRLEVAHRYAYEWWVGPVPPELSLDHLCHNADASCDEPANCLHRRCVNPDHLEAVSQRTNLLRGRARRVA